MLENSQSALHIHQEAKAALRQAERAVAKTRLSLNRLLRERRQTQGEVTDADRQAEQAYQTAYAVYTVVLEHWRFVQSAVPKPKARHLRERSEADENGDDAKV